jgi:flagellar hook-length control protein FliK
LSPPELGSLKIEIRMSGGEMNARLEAETPAARSLLIDNLPALRERLAEHDIRVTRFDVDLMQEQSGGGMASQDSGREPGDRPAAQSNPGVAASQNETRAAATPRPHDGQLNVVI